MPMKNDPQKPMIESPIDAGCLVVMLAVGVLACALTVAGAYRLGLKRGMDRERTVWQRSQYTVLAN